MNKKVNDYILKLFAERFPQYNKNIKRSEILEILYNNIYNSERIKIYSVDDVLKGHADKIIIKLIDDYFRSEKKELWEASENLKNHIKRVIYDLSDGSFSKDIFEYIVNQISASLIKFYNYNELNNGGFEDRIKILYEDQKKFLEELLLSNIRRVLNKEIDSHVYVNDGINQMELEKYVLLQLLNTANYNLIVNGDNNQFDKDILNIAKEYIVKNKRKPVDSHSHIMKTIAKEDNSLSEQEVVYYTKRIDEALRLNGFNSNSIVDKKNESEIIKWFYYFKQRRLSIKEKREKEKAEQKAEKIKYEKRKRMVYKSTIALILSATLLGMGFLLKHGIDNTIAHFRERRALKDYKTASAQMNEEKYGQVFTKYSDQYQKNMELTVNNYRNFSKLGETYGYLSFYDAYMHISADKLAIMDSMLSDIQDKYGIDVDADYYIEFMYNRLAELGCEDVLQEKYINVIREYRFVALNNDDETKTTWDCLNEGQKKLINEIADLYKSYSSEYYKQFSNIGKGRKL
ncbi:MAG: hypothetical protein IJE89_00940 [Bacilli bacterium]|nr:hypothetical protein [Bacilli bacterium]